MTFHSNYGSKLILYHLRDKARYWSNILIFHTPPAFDVPVRGEGAMTFGTEKVEWRIN